MTAGRRARLLGLAAVLAALPSGGSPEAAGSGLKPGLMPVSVVIHRINAFRIGSNQVRFGPLTYLGGFEIEGRIRHFGGFSALEMLDGGRRMLALADNGIWFTAEVEYDGSGRPYGLAHAGLAPIVGASGKPLIDTRQDSDSEGLSLSRDGGKPSLLVSFERDHRIVRYPFDPTFRMLKPGRRLKIPRATGRLSYNKGLEALAEFPGGAGREPLLVAIAERARNAGDDLPGWFRRGGKWSSFHVRKIGAFQATDAAFLPDGDLLLLERRFNLAQGVGMRIRRFRAGDFRKGARLEGQVLLTADFAYQIDNMEGLAVHRNARGETIVSLISDDNRSILQRTLFLQFRYTDRRTGKKPGELRGSTDG